MYFMNTLIRSKNRWLNPSFVGSLNEGFSNSVQSQHPLNIFRSKATLGYEARKLVVSAPTSSVGADFSCAVRSPWSHYKFRCESTFEYARLPDDLKGYTEELGDFTEKVKAMTIAGNKDGASDLLIAKLEDVKQKVIAGHKGISEAIVLDVIGISYLSLGDLESVGSVVEVLAEVVEGIKLMDLNVTSVLDHVHTHMGLMYGKLGKYKESLRSIEKAVELMEIRAQLFGNCDKKLISAVYSLASLKRALGNVDEAIPLYKKALNLQKGSMDKDSLNKKKEELAKLLHYAGRGTEAREFLGECLEAAKKGNGEEAEDYRSAVNMCNLGISHLDSKNFEEAETMLRAGLRIMAKFLDPDDLSFRLPKMHLSAALTYFRRGKEAEELALEALHISEKSFGEDSLEVVDALDYLWAARAVLPKMDDEGQFETLKRSLRIQEKAGKEESELFVLTLERMGTHLARLGRTDDKLAIEKSLLGLKIKTLN